MEFALRSPGVQPSPLPLEPARVADAFRAAVAAIGVAASPREGLDNALGALHERLDAGFVAALAVEHDRLWLVGSRGYATTPDGLPLASGVVGRAARSGRVQYVPDLAADPDYVDVVHGVASELAVPLRAGGAVVGVVNIETVAPLPREAPRLVRPLAEALGPVLEAVRSARLLDLSALARLFVYLSSLREPREIAEIAVASLTRILPLETSQLFLRADDGSLSLTAARRVSEEAPEPLTVDAAEALRAEVDLWTVLEQIEVARLPSPERFGPAVRSAVLVPLRANGEELGVLVGTSRWTQEFDQGQAEVAAVLAAQVAASLDAALSLGRAHHSALTDPLTDLLNRRGFEVELERSLAVAHERRRPVSLCVLDCDDFKDVNDRAGHEFGDALLREVGHVLASILPEGARAARMGGDEFVVMLPDADAESAEAIAIDLRSHLSEGLDEAGFPLRLSVGIATYPFDGGGGSQLVRAADQALYEAKATGKNRVVGFRELLRKSTDPAPALPVSAGERRAQGRVDVTLLVETSEGAAAIWREESVDEVLLRLCRTLTFVVGATGCNASRVDGPRLVDEVAHSLRAVELAAGTAYLIEDFPLTKSVLESRESRAISFLDADLDRAEAFVLRELGMNSALLVPIVIGGRAWGLIELYDMRLRRYSRDQQAVADFLVGIAAQRIEALGDADQGRRRLRLYRPPAPG